MPGFGLNRALLTIAAEPAGHGRPRTQAKACEHHGATRASPEPSAVHPGVAEDAECRAASDAAPPSRAGASTPSVPCTDASAHTPFPGLKASATCVSPKPWKQRGQRRCGRQSRSPSCAVAWDRGSVCSWGWFLIPATRRSLNLLPAALRPSAALDHLVNSFLWWPKGNTIGTDTYWTLPAGQSQRRNVNVHRSLTVAGAGVTTVSPVRLRLREG